MKAVVLDAVNKISLKSVDQDKLQSNELLVRVEAAGICGSDRHILHGTYPANYPVILGHEFSGIIENAGTSSRFKVGDRVNVNPNIACGNCLPCKTNLVNLCRNNIAHGVNRNGGLADFVAVPETQLFKLPLSLAPEMGAFCEPIACCIQGLDLANIKPGDSVNYWWWCYWSVDGAIGEKSWRRGDLVIHPSKESARNGRKVRRYSHN